MKIDKFEDIKAWKEARLLTRDIYKATKRDGFLKDFSLVDQVRRASVSIMANIAEGFDAGSNAEFCKFLSYSQRSASELQSHLYVALDQNYISSNVFRELYDKCYQVKSLIGGFIKYLKGDQSKLGEKNQGQRTTNEEQGTKNKEQRTKNKEQRTTNQELRTKNYELRTRNKELRT